MNVLGIETSCDETAVAVVRDGKHILSNVVSSQIQRHAAYGGVVPELAAREHLRNLAPVATAALRESGLSTDDLDAVAVTHSPGLVPALLVGISYAKGLAASLSVPLIGVNHILAHVYAAALQEDVELPREGPYVALVVSGGHTMLLLIREDGRIERIGQTLDDAAGEAFDKAAAILELGYPGGPRIDQLSRKGRADAYAFPRGLSAKRGRPEKNAANRLNFSFSGLKTALLYNVRERELSEAEIYDITASFQEAVIDSLVDKTMLAVQDYGATAVIVTGGVACNSHLRQRLQDCGNTNTKDRGATPSILPVPFGLATDNAAMIAALGFHQFRQGDCAHETLQVQARFACPEHFRFPRNPSA